YRPLFAKTMFGFKKHCTICGIDLQNQQATKRFGKFFCSGEHASEYTDLVKSQIKENDSRRHRGGCC
ncbi:MAG: hypothetical protein WD966_01890, partial [Nitrosopumilaceae archaeon]